MASCLVQVEPEHKRAVYTRKCKKAGIQELNDWITGILEYLEQEQTAAMAVQEKEQGTTILANKPLYEPTEEEYDQDTSPKEKP